MDGGRSKQMGMGKIVRFADSRRKIRIGRGGDERKMARKGRKSKRGRDSCAWALRQGRNTMARVIGCEGGGQEEMENGESGDGGRGFKGIGKMRCREGETQVHREEEGERQLDGTVEEEGLQLVVRGGEGEVSAGRKMTGEGGGGGDGGTAVRSGGLRLRRRLEDGDVAMTAEKNRSRGKEWRLSRRWRRHRSVRWRRRRLRRLDSFPSLP